MQQIGIIMNKPYLSVNAQTLRGIFRVLAEAGYSASVFTIADERVHSDFVYGEKNLFRLIHFKTLAGIIFLPFTFTEPRYCEALAEQMHQTCTVPVVTIGIAHYGYPHLWHNNRTEFANIVTHLITKHHCRRIVCLTGFTHFPDAVERLNGYRDAMAAAGLPCGADTEFYGNFWYNSGEQTALTLLQREQLPDAVVCANDQMAIGVCDTLRAHGVRVRNR